MGFRSPEWFWLGLLALPLIALYILKIRRVEQKVASTLLWRTALRELDAQVPFRRLRRDWLLLLQLLILALIVLALADPYRRAWLAPGVRHALVVDSSARMLAAGREAETRRVLHRLADGLGPGDELAVVRAGQQPEVLAPLTRDRTEIRRALDRWRPVPAPADLDGALVLAHSLAGEDGRIILVTDGADPPRPFDGLSLVRIGEAEPNVGIVSLGVRPANPSGREHEVFVRLRNASPRPARGSVSLRVEGAVRDAATVEIDADGEAGRTLRLMDVAAGALEVVWRGEATDALPHDDRAWWVLRPTPERSFRLRGEADRYLRHALGVVGGWREAGPGEDADVEVVLRLSAEPAGPPLLWIDPLELRDGLVEGGSVLTWEKTHPVLRFVNLHPVRLGRVPRVRRPAGFRVLAESTAGPLLLEGRRRERPCLVWAFDPLQTSLPLNVAYPLLVRNTLEHLAPAGGHLAGGIATASAARLPWRHEEPGRLVSPSGAERLVAAAGGSLELPLLEELGVWQLHGPGGEDRALRFGVSLLDASSVDLRPREDDPAAAPPGTPGGGRETAAPVTRALAWLFLFAGIGLLTLETFAFHRGWSP